MGSRRHFSREFKTEAVRMVAQGHTLGQVARDLGIGRSTLTRWRRQLEEPGAAAPDAKFTLAGPAARRCERR